MDYSVNNQWSKFILENDKLLMIRSPEFLPTAVAPPRRPSFAWLTRMLILTC